MRKADLRIDHVLSDAPPGEWAGEVEQVRFHGSGFSELDFLHRPSRTLVMTDLIANLETGRLPATTRIWAHLIGVAAPQGRAPIYLRLALKTNKRESVQTATRLIGWQPERVIFSHGRWFEHDGTQALRQSLDWLVG